MARTKAGDDRVCKPLSPTKIALASKCLHFYFLEEFGEAVRRIPPTAGQELERQRGLEFEARAVAGLRGVREARWDRANFKEGLEVTAKLLREGPDWIHGGAIAGAGMAGVPDLLQRIPGRTKLGDFAYRPVEIKNHKEVQAKDELQVAAYGRILEEILGSPCHQGGVFLNTGKIEPVNLSEIAEKLDETVRRMRLVLAQKSRTEPTWCSSCGNCPWIDSCTAYWEETDHPSLLPNGGMANVDKLRNAGIRTVAALAKAEPKRLAEKSGMTESAARRLWQHAKARTIGRPLQIRAPDFPIGKPIVFYDIETFGGTTFLHGAIRLDGAARDERFFFADRLEDAPTAWRDFLRYIARDKDSVIYCWADYERGLAEKSWKLWGGEKAAFDSLMGRLVDQCKWTQAHFAFPTRSYSIKAVAPTLGFSWKAADAGGMNCEAWYGEWLRTGDSRLKAKILEYNKDDVLAMEVIHNSLRRLSNEKNNARP